MTLWKALLWLLRVVVTFYVFESAFNLMTYPNDGAFIGGLVMLLVVCFYWGGLVYKLIEKPKKEEKNA